MAVEPATNRSLLGWREWIALPELGIGRIKAKVDTGARTSALHAFRVEPFQRGDDNWVSFSIHPLQHDNEQIINCEARVIDSRLVRDSGGHEEQRYVIATTIGLGDAAFTAEFTLTDRDTMKFRVLIGRTALRGHYMVDPGRSFLCKKNLSVTTQKGR